MHLAFILPLENKINIYTLLYMYLFLKTLITAAIIVSVSEIAKKYTWAAAILVSLPLTSLLAFIWLYWDTKDTQESN